MNAEQHMESARTMSYDFGMRTRISKGGQVSIPAAIRRRWATDRVEIEDRGNALVLRPLPADPIAAAMGSLRRPGGLTSEELRALERAEEARIEAERIQRG
jgi:bifunctional DNA-binding transcriptional regulator/antitoxin component of YhaV-PrlF toxin-antitoxin module